MKKIIEMLACRLKSHPNEAGVEKFHITSLKPGLGLTFPVSSSEVSENLKGYVSPMGVMMVKGWTRSVSAYTIMLCAYECADFANEWPSDHRGPLVCKKFADKLTFTGGSIPQALASAELQDFRQDPRRRDDPS